ncbi:MAG: hypothetical protein IJS50_03835 [Desulfovibrio sp.]|nr:hypothetical protein [Desulfovibrio sp.]
MAQRVKDLLKYIPFKSMNELSKKRLARFCAFQAASFAVVELTKKIKLKFYKDDLTHH